MEITKEAIIKILDKVKECVRNGRFRISQNPNRLDNINFINRYRLTSEVQKQMILSLDICDFSKIEEDRKDNRQILYFFGKDYELNHIDRGIEEVEAYIKFTMHERVNGDIVLFISFHEAKWPIEYYFKNS